MFPIASDQIWVCRMCEHLASAIEKGLDCCGIADCGSPLRGRVFPCYRGPLSGNLDKYCFICGCDAEGKISFMADGLGGIGIGVCEKHCEEMFRRTEEEKNATRI